MQNTGKAVIFCAPSGAGKTTIVRHLVKEMPSLSFSISATTRNKRNQEKDGADYYFLSIDKFKEKVKEEALYEWQEVYENTYYGTLKSEVERIWKEGKHVIFDVDVVGGVNLKKALGEKALAVFVSVSDVNVLEERLRSRNTESEKSLQMRIGKAKAEMSFSKEFDYVLINHDLDKALMEAKSLVSKFVNK